MNEESKELMRIALEEVCSLLMFYSLQTTYMYPIGYVILLLANFL